MENKLKVGVTHGDVNGIGYELIVKMMAENKICEVCIPVLYGSSKVAAYHRKNLNVENFSLSNIQSPREANAKRCSVINCVDDAIKVDPGQETPESDEAAMIALKLGLEQLDKQEIDVLAAAPQGSGSFKLEQADGCLEYMAKRYNTKRVMPILVGQQMKMAFATTHVVFKDIAASITANNIYDKLRDLDTCLKRDFVIQKPRIAVLGLNPHSGENCLYGEEEKNVIVPAIEKARNNGIMALGPYNADSFFSGTEFQKFDVVLAMYHDQGMIPFRTLEGNEGAVLVAGLPVVYTSTVHGMAYDIVGQGIADDAGLRNAVYLGIDVYNNRMREAELTRNPLRHYDIAGNNNETDLNVEQIAGVKAEED